MIPQLETSDDSLKSIKKVILSLIEISQHEWNYYSQHLETKHFNKKEIVLQANTVCNNVYFVNKGLLRVFFIDKDGNESTFHFARENDFAVDYQSFLQNTPAQYYIQALEQTEAVLMSKYIVNDGYSNLKNGEKLGRLLAEKHFVLFGNKLQSIYTQSPIERYLLLKNDFPDIFQRIPQHYIASYLNISSVHLSRLKNNR